MNAGDVYLAVTQVLMGLFFILLCVWGILWAGCGLRDFIRDRVGPLKNPFKHFTRARVLAGILLLTLTASGYTVWAEADERAQAEKAAQQRASYERSARERAAAKLISDEAESRARQAKYDAVIKGLNASRLRETPKESLPPETLLGGSDRLEPSLLRDERPAAIRSDPRSPAPREELPVRGSLVPCSHCHQQDLTKETCTHCQGRDLTKETCTHCQGRDLTKETCNHCWGRDLTKETCNHCRGSGTYRDSLCVFCSGRGKKDPCIFCSGRGKKDPCIFCSGRGKQNPCMFCSGRGLVARD